MIFVKNYRSMASGSTELIFKIPISSMQVSYNASGYIRSIYNSAVWFPNGVAISGTVYDTTPYTQTNALYGGGAAYIDSLPMHVFGWIFPQSSISTAELRITAAKATIFIQTAYLSNTTPANTHTLTSLQWTTAGATTITTGSLSWQATGE